MHNGGYIRYVCATGMIITCGSAQAMRLRWSLSAGRRPRALRANATRKIATGAQVNRIAASRLFLCVSVYVLLPSARTCWIIDVFAVVWRRGSAPIKVVPCHVTSIIAVAHSLQVACSASRRRRRPFHCCWQRRGRRSSHWNRFVL
jgi:hypothetical protein